MTAQLSGIGQFSETVNFHIHNWVDICMPNPDSWRALAVFVAVILVVPFDTTQLLLMVIGAAIAAMVHQSTQPPRAKKEFRPRRVSEVIKQQISLAPETHNQKSCVHKRSCEMNASESTLENSLPKFATQDFPSQVDELVEQLVPSDHCQAFLGGLVSQIKTILQQIFPDIEVNGVASGDASRRTAFAVAAPELHVMIAATPSLMSSVHERLRKSGPLRDAHKVNKTAVQTVSAVLIQNGFKFRRSAFRSHEPKVTLIAPSAHDGDGIVLDVGVDNKTPLCDHALLCCCVGIDARAGSLILLVKRWAKYRGLCHTSQGHLSPYAWALMAMYYLQVQKSILPSIVSSMSHGMPEVVPADAGTLGKDQTRVCWLFQGFIEFYLSFNWSSETISVCKGKQTGPFFRKVCNGPNIEDPFETNRNVGETISESGFTRLCEELARAQEALGRGALLSELLEPWVPSSTSPNSDEGDDSGEQTAPEIIRKSSLHSSSQGTQTESSRRGILTKPQTMRLSQKDVSLRPHCNFKAHPTAPAAA